MGMFDMEIRHIAGVKNTAADALWRIAYQFLAQPDEWLNAYSADARIRAHYFHATGQLTDPYRYYHGRLWADDRILVPRAYVRQVIEQHHADPLHGRWGLRNFFD